MGEQSFTSLYYTGVILQMGASLFIDQCYKLSSYINIKYSHMRLRALDTKLSQFLGSQAAGDTDVTHKPGGRLPLLSSSPAVTFPAKDITPMAGINLYCLVTEARRCK